MGVTTKRLADGPSDGLAGEIVLGRPKTAAHDDDVATSRRRPDDADEPGEVVTYGMPIVEVYTDSRELLGYVGSIRIRDLAQQKLGADSDDFRFQVCDSAFRGEASGPWIGRRATGSRAQSPLRDSRANTRILAIISDPQNPVNCGMPAGEGRGQRWRGGRTPESPRRHGERRDSGTAGTATKGSEEHGETGHGVTGTAPVTMLMHRGVIRCPINGFGTSEICIVILH